ncbi:MAG TPA: LytR C-terminal domain-containing protein [Pseudobacteroides sp.]|uniref:LytR C-terminal domain-containing protein n=1 Tax=Pseudobacteroides sp. TaxID=1968840 RepID=UPI002F945B3B
MAKSNKKNILNHFEHIFLLFGSIVIIVVSLVVAVNFTKDSRIFAKDKPAAQKTVTAKEKKEVPSTAAEVKKEETDATKPKNQETTSPKNERKTSEIKVEIINSTGKKGVGTTLGNTLKNSGIKVISVISGKVTTKTKVIERNDNGYGDEVISLIKTGRLSKEKIKNSNVDVTIVLGADYLP